MSVEIQSLNEGKGLLYIYRGVIRYEDDRRANELMRDRHDRSGVRFTIIEHRNVKVNLTTNAEIRMAARFCIALSQQLPKHIVAVITPDDLSFGLGRMWQTLADETGWSMAVFRDMSAAAEWLHQEYRDIFEETLEEILPAGVLVPEMGQPSS